MFSSAEGILLAAFVTFSLALAFADQARRTRHERLTSPVAPRCVTSDELSLWEGNPDVQTDRYRHSHCRVPFCLRRP
jgi:hypothetical protein